MGAFIGLVIVILLCFIFVFNSTEKKPLSGSGMSITINNPIVYPKDIKCENCGNEEFVTMRDLDSSTWDMICPKCKKIAYEHPKREERKRQLDDMLN